jgi:CDP-diacylglycerol--glycerol-3-phosphate 3-phosphatidyltransferase
MSGFVIVSLWERNQLKIGFLLMILASFSDYADGYCARRWNQVSKLGSILDPIADKIFYGTLIGYGWAIGWIPSIPLVLVVTRDLGILLGFTYLKIHKSPLKTIDPIWISKLNTACLLAALLASMSTQLGWTLSPNLLDGLWISVSILTIMSGYQYQKIFKILLRKSVLSELKQEQ